MKIHAKSCTMKEKEAIYILISFFNKKGGNSISFKC